MPKFKEGDKVVMVTPRTVHGGSREMFMDYNPRGYAIVDVPTSPACNTSSTCLVVAFQKNNRFWYMEENELKLWELTVNKLGNFPRKNTETV